MESGKSVERDKIIFPLIYNRGNVGIAKIMKDEYLHLQTVMKKPIMARPVIAYRKNPSLKDILVSTRLTSNADNGDDEDTDNGDDDKNNTNDDNTCADNDADNNDDDNNDDNDDDYDSVVIKVYAMMIMHSKFQ